MARPLISERPRLLSFPREISAAAMILVSGLGGLVLASPTLRDWVIGLAILLVHLLMFDAAFHSIRSRDTGFFIATVAGNIMPYILVLLAIRPQPGSLLFLGVALVILFLQVVVESVTGPGTELEYILGAAVPVLPALTIPSILGVVNSNTVIYWVLLTIYAVATAAYIESRLPWRSAAPQLAAVLIGITWASILVDLCIVVALVEPTLRYVFNAVRPRRIERTGLRTLGRITLVRLLLFVILVLFSLSIC